MTVRKLTQCSSTGGSPEDEALLRSTAEPIEAFDEDLHSLIQDLSDTLRAYPICVGLAAPQIGVQKAVAVVNPTRDPESKDLVLVNPTIISSTGKKDIKRESCMSVWGYQGNVMCRDKVTVHYFDENGQDQEVCFKGYEARIVTHEISHLNGILYIDHLSDEASYSESPIFDGLSQIEA